MSSPPVLRCQCSPPANATEQLEQLWNRTGFNSSDSIPWSSLNVSVRRNGWSCDPVGLNSFK